MEGDVRVEGVLCGSSYDRNLSRGLITKSDVCPVSDPTATD